MSIKVFTVDPSYDRPFPDPVDINHRVFSGGEIDVRIVNGVSNNPARRLCILAHVWSAEDLMTLVLITEALRKIRGDGPIDLIMPYVPYARQDRRCNSGEAFGLKVIADMINRQGYRAVYTADAHSVAAGAVIDRMVDIPAVRLATACVFPNRRGVVSDRLITAIVAPDAGAEKRALEVAIAHKLPLIQCIKHRNRGGQVIGVRSATTITEEHGSNWLVVDDICDGGATFSTLHSTLTSAYAGRSFKAISDSSNVTLSLFTTHSIYRNGTDELRRLYTGGLFSANVSEKADDYTKNVVQGSLDPNDWCAAALWT